MSEDGPQPCRSEGCIFFGSLQFNYYCSQHYRLQKSQELDEPEKVRDILPFGLRKKVEHRPSSSIPQIKTTHLLQHFQKEIVSIIDVKYARFISAISHINYLASLRHETTSKRLVELLIEEGERMFTDDDQMLISLLKAAKDSGNPLLVSLLLFNHMPSKESFRMFSVFVQYLLTDFMKLVNLTDDLLDRVASVFKLTSKNLDVITNSNADQHLTLLAFLPYRHSQWYPSLLYVLIQAEQYQYLQKKHEALFEEAVSGNVNYAQVEEYCQTFCNSCGDHQAIVKRSSATSEEELADFLLNSDDDSVLETDNTPVVTNPDLHLYPYQEELAEPAICGDNVIVVSPTNSGKTHVAMAVIKHHLQMNPKRCAIFIVPRQHLVEQQHALISKYFPDQKVLKIRGGGNSSQVNMKRNIMANNIVVSTAECLRNALDAEEERDRVLLNQFSLLVFDECHNCTKNHPYNMIMNHYHDANMPTNAKPKILGLTASPGTDRASTSQKALEHIITLCANLDCTRIAYKSDRDVTSQSQLPLAQRKPAPFRSIGWLDRELQRLSGLCEEELMNMRIRGEIPEKAWQYINIPVQERGMPPYDNFVGNLKFVDPLIPATQTETLVHLTCLKKFLNVFNRSLVIYRLFRDEDTINYLRTKLDFKTPANSIQRRLLDQVEKNIFQQSSRYAEDNPCMEVLLQCVRGHLRKEPDSRILVFVKQRTFTYFLKDAFNSDPSLKHVPVDVIIGAQKENSSNKGAASLKWQKEVLEKFHEGKNKVLFSTAVAEEGLDVVKCNVVIRYAHVTNEISMIQSKGRARTANPNYVLIYPSNEVWLCNKETMNEARHNMMVESIQQFQSMSTTERKRLIHTKQMQLQEARKTKAQDTRKSALCLEVNKNLEYVFHCKSCNRRACTSGDIRQRMGSFVCIDQSIKDRCIIMDSPDSTVNIQRPVICSKTCSEKWGVLLYFRDILWVSLYIRNFRLVPVHLHLGDGFSKICDKWKDAPFEIPEITTQEIYDCY